MGSFGWAKHGNCVLAVVVFCLSSIVSDTSASYWVCWLPVTLFSFLLLCGSIASCGDRFHGEPCRHLLMSKIRNDVLPICFGLLVLLTVVMGSGHVPDTLHPICIALQVLTCLSVVAIQMAVGTIL